MDDVSTMAALVDDIGVPILFFVLVLYLIFKCVPQYMEMHKEDLKAKREADAARQADNAKQMQVITQIAEQSNQMIGQATQVISQSTEVIRLNTEAIRSNTSIHEQVRSALSRDLVQLQQLTADLKAHDEKFDELRVIIQRLVDRVEQYKKGE